MLEKGNKLIRLLTQTKHMKNLDFYSIEKSGKYNNLYRFVSLYNGVRGTWHFGKKDAIQDGEKHKTLIIAMNTLKKQKE